MALSTVNVGTTANDGTGDPLRTAFQTVNTAITAINNGEVASRRNQLLNGAFTVWQKGASDFPDTWISVGTSGTTPTPTRESHTIGQTDVPGGGEHYFRWKAAGTSSGQPIIGTGIEDVRTLANRASVLSFYARADVSRTLQVRITQSFGSGGSSFAIGGITSFSVTTAWTKFSVALTPTTISGKTVGAGSYLGLRFYGVNGVTDQHFDFDLIQWELGATATPFEHRGFAVERLLCSRYYQTKTVRSENGARHIPLLPMRAVPTMAVGVGTAGNVTVDGFELTHTTAADCTVTASAEL